MTRRSGSPVNPLSKERSDVANQHRDEQPEPSIPSALHRGAMMPHAAFATARGADSTPVIIESADQTVDPLWYKDAIIYQLHVKAFFDGNDDGIGDFAGLISKLDYIRELGATAIWLLPFYPSPLLDDGYDISEYRKVNSDYGTMPDVRRFIKAAHARGIRV